MNSSARPKIARFLSSIAECSVAIGPDGDLYPCHRFDGYEEAIIGDVVRGIDTEKAGYFRKCDPYNVGEVKNCSLISECYKCIWLSFVKN